PDASTRDWEDVLRRARGSGPAVRALVLAAALALLAAALLVAAPALGFRQVADVFGSEPTPSWTWPEGVPGDPIKPPKLIVSANQTANGRFGDPVDLSSVRQIVSVGRGYGQSEFLAARGLDGDVCLTKLTGHGSAGAPFNCLHDLPKPGVPPVDQQAVMIGMSAGGHRGSVVDYASLIGVVRADVARVELELVDGETIELPLNRWRGFGYYATDPGRFPKTLRVYRTWSSFFRSHEKLVGELPLQQVKGLEPTPLCGGVYGPCPPGVKP
ncbi:MAG: hypothetical protein ACJ75Q_08665, partial [Gaiellaceae bacterium]